MTKLFVTLPALALAVILSGSAFADNGISSKTLDEMGLAGIQMMSDSEAMAIRGLGYDGGHHMPKPKADDKPWSLAFGISYAKVEVDGGYKSDTEASAGTLDGFIAEGKYLVEGSHGSEAGWSKTETKIVDAPGLGGPLTETHTTNFRVFAGGFAKASSL